MNDTFMKERPVLPLLLSMALPNVISMLVNSLYNIVDSLFVAQISEDAMTALSLVYPIQNFANAIAIGFGIGINAMIALYLGAGDRKKAEIAATHGMVLSLLHGVVITVVSIAIMPGFLRRFTTDESLVASGITYSTIVFLFATINMAALAFEKMFQAVGRMKVTMVALVFGCVCNILLDPVLIFGLGPVPAMGIAGAALATGIGQLLNLCVYLFVYLRTELPVRLSRSGLHQDVALDGKLYAIGVPAILNLALPSLLVTFLNSLLAGFSQSYVVILGIYYKLQTFLYLPANGIVQGMHPLERLKVVLTLDSPEVGRLKEACARLKVWGIFGVILKLEGHEAPGNCAIMINDEGEVVHQYCKMNPWIPTERHYPGWECPVTPGPKGSRIATIVCADGDYPEIWREAAYNGANVVVRITHYMNPWEEPWKLTNRCAAYCNQVYVVGANCYGMEHACAAFGNSMIVNPDGNIVTEAPMMVPYLLKADLYPGLVDKLHESSTTNTFLYSFRHRGAACKELGGHGETRNQYKAYTFGGDEK